MSCQLIHSLIVDMLTSHLEQLSEEEGTGDTLDGSETPATAGRAMSSC